MKHEENNITGEVELLLKRMSMLKTDPVQFDLQKISDHIENLFQIWGSEDIGDLIADAVHLGIFSLEQGCKFLNVSRWGGTTNGEELDRAVENWLEQGNDPIKISLALCQDIFPFKEKNKMNSVFTKIVKQFPQFSEAISKKIKNRDSQGI